MFWIVVAILTAAVAVVLMYPLMRKPEVFKNCWNGDVAVYSDQLDELQREREAELIGETEADYARVEIGRRLLAAVNAGRQEAVNARPCAYRFAAAFITLILPAIGLCFYIWKGSPDVRDMPLAMRLENPGIDMNLLITKAERHLAQTPDDGAGWDILAPIYFKTMRLGDAEMAYRNAMRLLGTSSERLMGLGETLVEANDGIVIETARLAFADAERLVPGNPRARFYLALSLEQVGRRSEAREAFASLAREAPPGAPWLPLVREHIVSNGETVPALHDGSNADDLVASQARIEGMVASLDASLRREPGNLDGWMRLVRAYAVLKKEDKASKALKAGLAAFPPQGEECKQLLALANELGISTTGIKLQGVMQ